MTEHEAVRSRDRRTGLPQLVGTAEGFRVFDPTMVGGESDVTEGSGGRLGHVGSAWQGAVMVLSPLLIGGGVSWALGAGFLSHLLWFLGAAAGSFLVIAIVMVALVPDRMETYRAEHRGAGPETDVAAGTPLGDLCALAEEIAETASWREGVVDPDRRLAAIVWSAASARGDPAAVDRTRDNLRELLGIAHDLDRRREGAALRPQHRAAHARDLSGEVLEHGRTVRDLS